MIDKILLLGALTLAPTNYGVLKQENATLVETTTEQETTPETNETSPKWEDKVYTFTEEDKTATITLISAKDYTMTLTGEEKTLKGNYELKDNILSLYYESVSFVKVGDFEIGANNVLTKYEPKIEVPTNKDEAVEVVKLWLEKWLSPEMVTTITTIVTLLVIVAIYLFKDTKNRKLAKLSNEELEKHIFSKIDDLISSDIAKEMEKVAPEIVNSVAQSNELMKLFAKILCLAQENTPESRVAIIELVEKLGAVDKETTELAKKVVVEEKETKEIKKEETTKELDAIIEDTNDGTTI